MAPGERVGTPTWKELVDALPMAQETGPEALPRGTRLGRWQVVSLRGRGTYGAVYRAVREGQAEAESVALKLSLYPRDPRFAREAELLSRIHHPSVPSLLDAGVWRHPSGRAHPFLVMEWVEGGPLYAWAARRNPSSRQVLRLLAQAARALQATHTVSGVHRDVKGDNTLVRSADGCLFLTDFGAGHYSGAVRLTPLPMLPGTPAYRSPEAWEYLQRLGPSSTEPYVARPADDVFALGVMAYRLVTDEYPPFTNPSLEEGRCWRPEGGGPRPPRQLNPRMDPQLNALILRMLSRRPEERGHPGELAEAMEQGVANAGPMADVPLFEWETLERSQWPEGDVAEAELLGHRPRRRDREEVREAEQSDAALRVRAEPREAQQLPRAAAPAVRRIPRTRSRRWLPWLMAVGTLALLPGRSEPGRAGEDSTVARSASDAEEAVALGDTTLSASAVLKAPTGRGIALEMPKQPLPGQLRPDSKGRCHKGQSAINGGCWLKVDVELEDCPGNGFVHRGGCYAPIFPPDREPASAPATGEPR
ncbi:serine/threonine protein kinase [Hyalangium rubrum]|uniref:non-specific serine/threonine protein kinase n=1 Tax=Hyalangium rubrum TaxID=3103134 RepID=A0ABU5GZS8_9BACT|nr:serine/threonine-protein kinase [Hyalangium sp. s54d21]MDY7226650.1 serine/threonine-protein kinase [Hyalangium sp. s54d21]